ncbi:response regulator transcription factor [Aurantivibrio plasticivorans]
MEDDTDSQESILVVDDDVVLAQVLERALARRGYAASVANDYDSALEKASENIYQKAVVDLKLAEASGLQLIPALLAKQPDMKLVMLTGYSSIATAVEAIKLGAVNYLSKPADIEEILNAFQDKTGGASSSAASQEFNPPSIDRLEWEHIQRVLQEHDGNISATARALGMHRRTLQRKLSKRPVKK